MSDGTGLTAEFKAEGNDRVIPNDQEEALLRVTQEALTNTLKHAKARNFKAALGVDSEKILLQLVDDGKGFEPQSEHDGFGLVGMKERVDQLGGQFILRSKPGLGTEIVVAFKSPATLKGRDQDGQV
jgi:signal transduction histidine kinase